MNSVTKSYLFRSYVAQIVVYGPGIVYTAIVSVVLLETVDVE
jgi:hypothetical protein